MKRYLLFVGQNATTGRPNSITGNMSFWGNIMRFDSIKTRNHYINNNRFDINETIVDVDARKYSLGMSINDYNEHIQCLDVLTMREVT